MVNVRIPRTATFAWSPGSHLPQIITGTVAGAVDADFSNETFLELWDLGLESGPIDGAAELAPKATINTDSRFYDIAWGNATSDRPRGIIAGGLESGSLNLWDAAAIDSGEGEALMSQTVKHTGPIKALQFNPFKPELLLTGGVKGEIYVWDLNNLANPFLLGNRAQRSDDFNSVDWNKKIPHILLSGGQNGLVTVWDVKQKKESLTLSHLGRKEVSAVAWHPDNATKLLTALPDDTNPVVMVWDLRNANAPERTLTGHDQGVLSLAWCKQDVDILLSSGKDNRTICWNPNNGEQLGEFPIGTNWMFQTRFNPRIPDLLATASYDGKIAVQSLQNKPIQTTADAGTAAASGEDFFANVTTQGPSFSLKQPPKWYRRPVGASFGFGGKLVSFTTPPAAAGQPLRSKLKISKFAVESEVNESTESFEKAISEGNLISLCETRASEAKTKDDKADWEILKTLFETDKKSKVKEYLGYQASTEDDLADDLAATKLTDDSEEKQTNGEKATDEDWFAGAGGGDESDNFLSGLSSTKGARTNNPFKIFPGTESESDKKITKALVLGNFEKAVDICLKEDRISDAFVLAIAGGQKTIDRVQKAYFNKQADGPNYTRMLASIVGKNLWDVVYNADLADWKEVMVSLCTYADDKEFSDLCEALGERIEEESKASDNKDMRKDAALCYLVGSKLEKLVNIWVEEYKEMESSSLKDAESSASSFSVHVRSIQMLIEKVTVFREATKFVDNELSASDNWKLAALYDKYCEYADIVASHGQLEVAEKYLNLLPASYPAAEIARNRVKHASGKVAPTARKTQARQPVTAARAMPGNTGAPPRIAGAAPIAQQAPVMQTPMQPGQPSMYSKPSNPYAPATSTPSYPSAGGSQYTPATSTSNYTPAGYQPQAAARGPYQPQTGSTGGYQPQLGGGPTMGGPPMGGPPRAFSPATTGPPPKSHQVKQDIPAWNDTPILEQRRRPTPSQPAGGPITSPFPNATPPTASPTGFIPAGPPQRSGTPGSGLPPPPKGALPPQRVVSPPQAGGGSAYQPHMAPQQSSFGQPLQQSAPPPMQQSNPYAPPPSGPSTGSGRYTPQAPAGGPPSGPPGPGAYSQPPPMQSGQSGRYTPQSSSQYNPGAQGGPPMGGPPMGGPPMGAPPMGAPPMGGPPMGGPPMGGGGQYAPPPPAKTPTSGIAPPPRAGTGSPRPGSIGPPKAATPAPKYPAGDRSHIPAPAKPIFDLLHSDMERVKGLAPPTFKRQVQDTEKRLGILFDNLNNETLLTPQTVADMVSLAEALAGKDFQTALDIQAEIHKNRMDECGNWMVGVKRLIEMSRATP